MKGKTENHLQQGVEEGRSGFGLAVDQWEFSTGNSNSILSTFSGRLLLLVQIQFSAHSVRG